MYNGIIGVWQQSHQSCADRDSRERDVTEAIREGCSAPRIYFLGRSQEAGDSIKAELNSLNGKGQYTFIKADVSLIRVVDDVCQDIKSREKTINLPFMSQGTFVLGTGQSSQV
ncbi:Oxidoreductase [Lachnellula subtilissima]|uniref:Oxidoreductase n=1 Tax=Lachnellula subtilissima TaxID=602034 RepID=A0A8H8RKB8_9HELO|nr:Oxidoreductase [Lachnellula subtilissima]